MTEDKGVWPEVELTDSEDEADTTDNPNKRNPLADCAPDLTTEEIEGDFPLFSSKKTDDSESESDEEQV